MSAPLIFTPEYYERMRRLEGASWWNAGMRDIAAMLLDDVSLPPVGTVLDVGCGSGQTMTWFEAIRPGWRAFGLDVAADGLRAAHGAGARVCRASALALPFARHSVNLVITLDVLQHLPLDGGDLQALREIHRVLTPGGYLFVRTNAQAFPATVDDPAYNFRKYTADAVRDRLTASGFAVERLSRVNALLGLAEILRELRARQKGPGYHGLLAEPRAEAGWMYHLKRQCLDWEGTLVRRGVRLPLGRSIVALCRA
ncbi:MAG: class I SAM-dependent methyltransferase [Vicinamibacteria bacterium]|nr:class I SAM-dependent methyltransferase [Vicinamibacteria bacterium]